MRSQAAVFVDAGYLIAAAATLLTGSSLRRGITVDYRGLIEQLATTVEEDSGLPLLRVYWYDAARNAVADPIQEGIAALPKVKLRLGRIGVEGEQKGVDLRIGLDMVSHSRNRAVDAIYLLSGDDDLTEAVEQAQAKGVQVTLLSVPNATGSAHAVSRHLIQAADAVHVLPKESIDKCMNVALLPTTEAPGSTDAHGTVPAKPSPALMPHRSPRSTPRPAPVRVDAALSGPEVVYSSGGPGYLSPAYQVDDAELSEKTDLVIKQALKSWQDSSTAEQQRDLRAGRPTIPSDLDRAMLVDLADALSDYNLPDGIRYRLRARFWELLDEASPNN